MEALVKKIRKVQNPDATKYKWKNMCLICQIVRLTGMRILVMCAFSWNKSVEFQAVHIKFNIEEDFLDSQVKVNHASEKRTNRNLRKKKTYHNSNDVAPRRTPCGQRYRFSHLFCDKDFDKILPWNTGI